MTKNTAYKTLHRYFKRLGISIDSISIKDRHQRHPLPNSIRSLSDTMDDYNIPNMVCELSFDQLLEVETPFIVMLDTVKDPFCMVEKIEKNNVTVYSPVSGISKKSVETFKKSWNGIILAGEKAENTYSEAKPLYTVKQFLSILKSHSFPVLCLLTVYVLVWEITRYPGINTLYFLSFLVKISGIFASSLIIYKTIFDSTFLERFCRAGKKGDCNSVLRSKAAKILNIVSLGELSFAYFSSTLLWGIFFTNHPLAIYALLSVIAFGFTLFSLIWQIKYKKWCSLCMVINAIVMLELAIGIIAYLSSSVLFVFSFMDMVNVSVCFVIILLAIIAYSELVLTRNKTLSLSRKNEILLSNPEFFQCFLENSPILRNSKDYAPLTNNKNDQTKLTVIISLHCSACADIVRTLRKYEDYQVELIFSANDVNEKIKETVIKFISIYLQDGWEAFYDSIVKWYGSHRFEKDIKINPTAERIYDLHKKYCETINHPYTPFLIINDRIYPSIYDLQELRLILT